MGAFTEREPGHLVPPLQGVIKERTREEEADNIFS
jgi:hypothetical protein